MTGARAGVLGCLAVLLVAGCGAGGSGAQNGSSAYAPRSGEPTTFAPPPIPRTSDAEQLARHVPDCPNPPLLSSDQGVAAVPNVRTHDAALLRAASASSCTLRGAGVVIFAFRSAGQLAAAVASVRTLESFSAKGDDWLALAEQDTAPAAQESVVQDVAVALGGVLVPGS